MGCMSFKEHPTGIMIMGCWLSPPDLIACDTERSPRLRRNHVSSWNHPHHGFFPHVPPPSASPSNLPSRAVKSTSCTHCKPLNESRERMRKSGVDRGPAGTRHLLPNHHQRDFFEFSFHSRRYVIKP